MLLINLRDDHETEDTTEFYNWFCKCPGYYTEFKRAATSTVNSILSQFDENWIQRLYLNEFHISEDWKSILIVAENNGIKSYFAYDIDNDVLIDINEIDFLERFEQ